MNQHMLSHCRISTCQWQKNQHTLEKCEKSIKDLPETGARSQIQELRGVIIHICHGSESRVSPTKQNRRFHYSNGKMQRDVQRHSPISEGISSTCWWTQQHHGPWRTGPIILSLWAIPLERSRSTGYICLAHRSPRRTFPMGVSHRSTRGGKPSSPIQSCIFSCGVHLAMWEWSHNECTSILIIESRRTRPPSRHNPS